YGTRGWRPGYGYRTIPVRGTIEVVWDLRPGRSDGEVAVAPAGGQPTGAQVKTWSLTSTDPGVGGLDLRRTYSYELFDPHEHPSDPVGSPLTPVLSLIVSGGATNWRVSAQAAEGLPEARWNYDPVAPPDFHPHFAREVLRGARSIRPLDIMGANATSL